jgi:conjugative relaxase-like TrwC/TraI family protein
VVSISPAKSASNGASYFDKDSYYSHDEDTSQWYGKGAEALGLEGAVKKDDFEKVLNGVSPEGDVLSKNTGDEDRRAYFDITLSAPKSVSLMSYIDYRIEEAHNRAVEKTIKEIEDNYSHTRMMKDGEFKTVKSDNLCMSRFNHFESRELDPQLHSHVVVMNLTKGEDGIWRSIETGDLYKNQLYLGQLYRNEMAKELKGLGYDIEVTDRNKGLYELKGVNKEIVDEFSTRRKQIEESREKYENYNVSEAKKMEYACLDSRRPKADAKIEEIRQDVEKRLEQYGYSLESLKTKSLEHAKEQREPHFDKEKCISMAVDEVTDKQSGFRREEVLSHAMKAGIGNYTADELKQELTKNTGLEELGSKSNYVGKTKTAEVTYYTTEDIRKTEQRIIERAEAGRGQSKVAVSEEKVKEHIDSVPEGKKLTEGQENAVQMVCTTHDKISLIQGDAGAGKSYACDHIRQIMEREGHTVRGFAPTGKASEELSKAGVETKTVDSFLESAQLGRTGVGKGEVWLVDEASMMGSKKLEKFLQEAEKHEAKVVLIGDTKQFQAVEQGKIFADLQKHALCEKVEITEVKRQKTEHAQELVKALKERDFEKVFNTLEEQKAFKEIADRGDRNKQVAEEYVSDRSKGLNPVVLTSTNADKNDINREIRKRLEKEGVVDSGKEYKTFQKADLNAVSRNFAETYKEGQQVVLKKDCEEMRKGTQATIIEKNTEENNIKLRYFDKESKAYKEKSVDCREHSGKMEVYDVVEKKIGVGDKVMFQKNDNNVGVKNGQTGTIKNIDEKGTATVGIGDPKKNNYREVTLNLDNKGDKAYTYVDHAYCQTSHKSQGSTYDKCIASYDVSKHKTNFNEAYVAATRQEQDVTVYTNDKKAFKEQVQLEQNKISTLDPVFKRFEDKLQENRQEVMKETLEKIQSSKADMTDSKERQTQQKAAEQNKGKEQDYGLSL